MDKRFCDRVARVTYVSLLWGFGVFIVSFKLEGWGMDDILMLISDPVGILGIALIGISATLFILNILRKELSPDEMVNKRKSRLPMLLQLRDMIKKYVRKSYLISKDGSLLNLRDYELSSESNIRKLFVLSEDNKNYLRLRIEKISDLTEAIDEMVMRLQSGKLEKLVYEMFRSEHKARSQQIVIRLYKSQYEHTDRNDEKLLKSEGRLLRPNHVKRFGKVLRKLYSYIESMEGGRDIYDSL